MALREINLVPDDILNRLHVRRHLFFWAGSLVVALTLVSGFFMYQMHVALSLQRPHNRIPETDAHLAAKIKEMKRLQGELEGLRARQEALATVTDSLSYSMILGRLARVINGQTWLTRLDMDMGKKREGGELKLMGFSTGNEDLGDFLNRISGEPLFKDVVLKYAREARLASHDSPGGAPLDLIHFSIECKI